MAAYFCGPPGRKPPPT